MDEQPKSFIQVIFEDVGSVLMPIPPIINATPLQVLACAEYLHIIGESGLLQEHNRKMQEEQRVMERKKIIVPGMNDEELMK